MSADLLEHELAAWDAAGKSPRFFLRDDDAIEDTPALRRLFEASESAGAPLLLASIAAHARPSLGEAVRGFGLASGAVHGFAHANHAPVGQKPCELDHYRPLATVMGELGAARDNLLALFGGRLSGLLVPPWNRIHDAVAAHVHELGFTGISAHGWLTHPPVHRLATVNAHIDIVHWSGGAIGRDWPWMAGELATALFEARLRGFRAIGILTHHLVHDDAAWRVLAETMAFAEQNGINWVAADTLIGEPAEKPAPLHQA